MNAPIVDFSIIGGHKCSSTWLYEVLDLHPGTNMSKRKELHFFSYHYQRGLAWYADFWDMDKPGLRGEASPSYSNGELALGRLLKVNPDAKVILVLRNPLKRLRSNIVHWSRQEGQVDPARMLEDNPIMLENSLYADKLATLNKLFGPKRSLVLFHDEIVKNPKGLIEDALAFLGLEYDRKVEELLGKTVGGGYTPKSVFADRAKEFVYGKLNMLPKGLAVARRLQLDVVYRKLNAKSGPVAEVVIPKWIGESFCDDLGKASGLMDSRYWSQWQAEIRAELDA